MTNLQLMIKYAGRNIIISLYFIQSDNTLIFLTPYMHVSLYIFVFLAGNLSRVGQMTHIVHDN